VVHGLLFGVATRLHYSLLVAAGVVGIVVLKFSWRKLKTLRRPLKCGG
jgi:hypothetical protein